MAQIVFVLVLGAIVLFTWPRAGVVTVAAQRQDDLVLGLMLGQLVLLILAIPAAAAVAVTREKEGGTYELLYCSRLSVTQIILGKVAGALAVPLTLIVSVLPFTGMLAFRGAVDVTRSRWDTWSRWWPPWSLPSAA